jgi:hypothetical protein
VHRQNGRLNISCYSYDRIANLAITSLAGVDRLGDALETIHEALALTEDSEERWSEAELQRLKGEILLMQDGRNAASKAASCFLKDIDVARSQEAKSWELRAATSLRHDF